MKSTNLTSLITIIITTTISIAKINMSWMVMGFQQTISTMIPDHIYANLHVLKFLSFFKNFFKFQQIMTIKSSLICLIPNKEESPLSHSLTITINRLNKISIISKRSSCQLPYLNQIFSTMSIWKVRWCLMKNKRKSQGMWVQKRKT